MAEGISGILQIARPESDFEGIGIILSAVSEMFEPMPQGTADHQVKHALVGCGSERAGHKVSCQLSKLLCRSVIVIHPP